MQFYNHLCIYTFLSCTYFKFRWSLGSIFTITVRCPVMVRKKFVPFVKIPNRRNLSGIFSPLYGFDWTLQNKLHFCTFFLYLKCKQRLKALSTYSKVKLENNNESKLLTWLRLESRYWFFYIQTEALPFSWFDLWFIVVWSVISRS